MLSSVVLNEKSKRTRGEKTNEASWLICAFRLLSENAILREFKIDERYKIQTAAMVSKYHTLKDDFKEIIGFIRDAAIVYFIGEKIAKSD